MTTRDRRKPPPVPSEIRVRLDADFLAGRPDAAAVVARVAETLRQGLPYARVDLAPPPRNRLAGYAACLLLGAGVALAAAVLWDAVPVAAPAAAPEPTAAAPPPPSEPPTPGEPDVFKPAEPAPSTPRTYTLGIPLPPATRAPDEPPEALAHQLAVCAGLSSGLREQRPITTDLAAALEDASRTLERSSMRQAERARVPSEVAGRWRGEGTREARGHLDRKDLRSALRRLAECRAAVGREIALPP